MNPYRILALGVSVLIFSAGCGKKSSSSDTAADARNSSAQNSAASSSGDKSSNAASADASVPGRAIEITANDQMKFSETEIHAKAGEALSLTLRNVGTVPKFSMGHNWVLLKETGLVEPFVAESAQAATTDYIPADQRGNIIAATKLLGPNESDTVNFKAPDKPGRYPYVCSFPGHYQVGMHGDLIVE